MSVISGTLPDTGLVVVGAFFAALLLVDSYDIALPRGDSISVAGPLVASMIVSFGPLEAIVLGMVSAMCIQGVRSLRREAHAPLSELSVRAASMAAGVGVNQLLIASGLEAGALVVVPAVYLFTELTIRQVALSVRRERRLRRLLAGNLSRQALLFMAQLSVSALTVLTYSSMGAWSLLPVVALLLLMRQAYAMLLEIRETYQTTVGVLVEAAESHTEGREGHSDRTAVIAREIAEHCGLPASEVERVNYSALLHDLDMISDTESSDSGSGSSSRVVSGIEFFQHVVPILRVIDGDRGLADGVKDEDLLAGFIVALASDIDEAAHTAQSMRGDAVARVSGRIPARLKAEVVSSALGLGYPVPAID